MGYHIRNFSNDRGLPSCHVPGRVFLGHPSFELQWHLELILHILYKHLFKIKYSVKQKSRNSRIIIPHKKCQPILTILLPLSPFSPECKTLPSYTSPANISYHAAFYNMYMRRCLSQHTVLWYLCEQMLSLCSILGTTWGENCVYTYSFPVSFSEQWIVLDGCKVNLSLYSPYLPGQELCGRWLVWHAWSPGFCPQTWCFLLSRYGMRSRKFIFI